MSLLKEIPSCIAKSYERVMLSFMSVEKYWEIHEWLWKLIPGSSHPRLEKIQWRMTGYVATPLHGLKSLPSEIVAEIKQLERFDPDIKCEEYWKGSGMLRSPNHLVAEGEIYFKVLKLLAVADPEGVMVFEDHGDPHTPGNGLRIIGENGSVTFECGKQRYTPHIKKAMLDTLRIDQVIVRLMLQMPVHSIVVKSKLGVLFVGSYKKLIDSLGIGVEMLFDYRGNDGEI